MSEAVECPDGEACEAVDVALDVALEAAEGQEVRQHIRRAQQARVAERDGAASSTQVEKAIVREGPVGTHDLNKEIVQEATVDGLEGDGWGVLHAEAFDHIRDVTDPRDYPHGTHLATITFDVVERTYSIEWQVYLGPLQRIQDYRWSQEGLSP